MRTRAPKTTIAPAYEGSNYALVLADCIDALAFLPPRSVDLAFLDPPYFLSNGGTTCAGGQRAEVEKGQWDASEGVNADHRQRLKWFAAVSRVLAPTGTIWVSGTHHAAFSSGFALQQLGFDILNVVTWYKPNAAPNLACKTLTHSTEILIWAAPPHSTRPRFNYADLKAANGGKQLRDLWCIGDDGAGEAWRIPPPSKSEKAHGKHTTQKPLALLERIVAACSGPGDLVLDPFCGSGTTGVAALNAHRRFIGVDNDAEYLALAHRRIQSLTAPLAL